MDHKPTAIIDIGSNSVRLMVYAGPKRIPYPLFNEKVLAGLGAGLEETGSIDPDSQECALDSLRRFKLLIDRIGPARTKVVATAAVREADNGPQFVTRVKALGLPCRVVSAQEEAALAGLGVISGVPEADGIVGDLGGGSLELVDVANGRTGSTLSVPMGVLRVKADSKSTHNKLRRAIKSAGLSKLGTGRAFYMVGGSWRALAKLDMASRNSPLPIIHQYRIDPDRVPQLRKLARSPGPDAAKYIGSARLATAPAAAMLLQAIVDELKPSELIVSSFGIRDGLLYSSLSPGERRKDPLIEAARELSTAEAGRDGHGDALHGWLEEAFDDPPELARLRLVACLLTDAARRTVAQFRAERTIEMALHGAWAGIDVEGRILVAQALSTSFGRHSLPATGLEQMADPDDLKRAAQWGLAIRAGERLSAGVSAVLRSTRLSASDEKLQLRVPRKQNDLLNGPVLRRLTKLANALKLDCEILDS